MYGSQIRTDQQEALPTKLVVPIHPVRIQQLFTNLISNAIDSCESHPRSDDAEHVIRIHISKDGHNTTIKVSDTGKGIPATIIDSIWKQSFTTKTNGTGRGLTIVKHITEQELHGSITVTSIVEHGTTFTITIPNTHLA
jgi:signal transduction histidine kinase